MPNDHGLSEIGACADAQGFASNYLSLQDAWDACVRPEWLLWLIGRTAGAYDTAPNRKLAFLMAACLKPLLALIPATENRPHAVVALLEQYGAGAELSMATLSKAAEDAMCASYALDYVAAHMGGDVLLLQQWRSRWLVGYAATGLSEEAHPRRWYASVHYCGPELSDLLGDQFLVKTIKQHYPVVPELRGTYER